LLFLTDEDVKTLLPLADAIQVVQKAFREVEYGNVRITPRQLTEISEHNGLMLSMPAYIGGEIDALGQKVVTIYTNNPTQNNLPTTLGTVQLLDPENGSCLAVIAANALTAIRTGAASAVATECLATENSDTIALFGVGVQAASQLQAICIARDIRQIKVYAPTREHVTRFCREMSQRLESKMCAATNPNEAIENCDIIVCATTSKTPVFDGKLLEPGMHLNGIGSHTADAREFDTTAILKSKVVVDSRESALAEAGDLIIPLTKGAISVEHIWAELGQIVAGKKKGRTSEDEITLFKSVGIAAQDVASAKVIYERAVRERRGLAIDLN
jgi:alanine dehydrogenase